LKTIKNKKEQESKKVELNIIDRPEKKEESNKDEPEIKPVKKIPKSLFFNLEYIYDSLHFTISRTKVIGGWLVITNNANSINQTFIKDTYHDWEIKDLKKSSK